MPAQHPYLTVDEFLRTLYSRVRLTCRYLELLLDCSQHEFLLEDSEVQRDWVNNVEALRWLAGPIYRLTAAFKQQCAETNTAVLKEVGRQEGRLSAFYDFLCEIHKAYNRVENVLTDPAEKEIVHSRHQHLQIGLNFLVDICNGWLDLIVNSSGAEAVLRLERNWHDSQFLSFWDELTTLRDVPPDFRDLDSQVSQVRQSAALLRNCTESESRNKLVLSLCMQTRRLLLMLMFHLLTVRPTALIQLRAARSAFEEAESAAQSEQNSNSDPVRQSLRLLRSRYNILIRLTTADDAGNFLELLERTSLPELAEVVAE